jgi:LAO/AO transport system kinase
MFIDVYGGMGPQKELTFEHWARVHLSMFHGGSTGALALLKAPSVPGQWNCCPESVKEQKMEISSEDLVRGALDGSVRAVARLISMVEKGHVDVEMLLAELFPYTGKAIVLGVSGPPGSGKSTLVDKLAMEYSQKGKKVGVIAVDPSSPFTGGAFLGDRFRMSKAAADARIFIRSLGARGQVGGLSREVRDIIMILDAVGNEVVIVETIGTGQDEVDIRTVADTTVIVQAPGLGDYIQTLKAGMMEIGDVYVVNKAESPEADNLYSDIRTAVEISNHGDGWIPPVVKTIANRGDGVTDCVEAIERHLEFLRNENRHEERRKERVRTQLLEMIKEKLMRKANESVLANGRFEEVIRQVMKREVEPYVYVNEMVELITGSGVTKEG